MPKIDILNGINVAGQQPLDAKGYFLTLNSLKDLGENNINTYKYYEDMPIYCVENHKHYIWREELEVGELEGVLETSFTYPTNSVSNGVDYSNRTFNFFVTISGNEKSNNEGLDNGTGTYTIIQYAEDASGLNMTSTPTPTSTHIGIAYNQPSIVASTDPNEYSWEEIATGLGAADGLGTYTWIKYSLSNDGFAVLQDSPTDMKYMGIALQQATEVESSVPGDYEWHLIDNDVSLVNQNNKVRTIDITVLDESEVTSEHIASWINENGLNVSDDENIIFNIIQLGDEGGIGEPTIPTLNSSTLDLSVTVTGDTTATLDWVNNGDTAITRYDVFLTNMIDGTYVIIPLSTVLTTNLIDLIPGANYQAYIVAYDANNNSKQSNTVTFEFFIDTFTPNIEVTAVSDVTVDLAWNIDAAFTHDRFELYQVGVGKIYDTTDVNDLSTQIIGLLENTLYQFYVIAYNGISASNPSATIAVTTLVTIDPPLTTPIINFIYSSVNLIKFGIVIPPLEYSRVTNFIVAYRILGLTVWKERLVDSSLIKFFDGLEKDTTYEIKVRSTTLNGETLSDWSNTITNTTLINPGIKLLIEPIEGTPTSSNITVYNGLPFQKVFITINCVIGDYTNNQIGWTGQSYLQNLAVNSPMLASISNNLPFEPHEITLDANGEYLDKYVMGAEYNNEALIPATLFNSSTIFWVGTLRIYDFDRADSPFVLSKTIQLPKEDNNNL